MRNTPIDPFAAEDILEQVDKILRGLGRPEPPIDLRDVRELLRLDLQFYSTSDTSVLREFVSKVRVGAQQLALRPTLIFDVVRQAGLKALWIPDRKRILIDATVPEIKKRHAEAHEIIHSVTPHHAPFLLGDDSETLRTSCHEKLEAEANFGSGQLLFPRKRFIAEAHDLPRTLETVQSLAKTFGNTITMALWRLVEEAPADEALFGVVSAHPKRPGGDFDPLAPCRYFIESPAFRARFGCITEVDVFEAMQDYVSWARGGSLGEADVVFAGYHGESHVFHMETFFNRHEALTLGRYVGLKSHQVAMP
jgi:Zn-dependent peptidase ImmA (M78 family)